MSKYKKENNEYLLTTQFKVTLDFPYNWELGYKFSGYMLE